MNSAKTCKPARKLGALAFVTTVSLLPLLFPNICFADLQGSLDNIKFQLTHLILPTLSVIGLAIAGISFLTGSPMAKQHMIYAILGCCFGFGAEAIMGLIRSIVN